MSDADTQLSQQLGGACLAIFTIAFFVQKYRTAGQEAHHSLSEQELQQQARLLDKKTRLVRSGFCDNYLFYMRNNNPLLAMLMPMSIAPIDAEEGILVVGGQMGLAYFLTGVQSNIKADDATMRWVLITAITTIPAMIYEKVLIWAAVGEEKEYQKMRAEGKDVENDPGVVKYKQENPQYKFLTMSDQFFNAHAEDVGKFKCMIWILLVTMIGFWAGGLYLMVGGVHQFLIGYLQTWAKWFITAPISFWWTYRSEEPAPSAYANLTEEEAALEQGGAAKADEKNPENDEIVEEKPAEDGPPKEHGPEDDDKEVDSKDVKVVVKFDPYKEEREAYEPEQCEKNLDLDTAKQFLSTYIGDTCCMSRGPIENMTFQGISHLYSMKYKFESFCEYRYKLTQEEPYAGGDFTWANDGDEPGLWEVEQHYDEAFVMEACKTCEVPYSSVQKTCGRCGGSGEIEVRSTDAEGNEVVNKQKCPRCDGHGQLREFKVLHSIYGTKVLTFVLNKTHLPDCHIRKVEGKVVGDEDEGETIEPLGDQFPQFFQRVSADLHKKFNSVGIDDDERIRLHKQRQSLQQVPVHEYTYEHNAQIERFFIYGDDNKVYCPYWPSSCIYCGNYCDVRFHVCACCANKACGCTIM